MKTILIAAFATSTMLIGSAFAQQATSAVPTSPQSTNSGQNSADPAETGDSVTPGAMGSSDVGQASAGDVTAVPGSPQATNNGQNSADPAQSGGTTETTAGSAGMTTGGNAPLQSNSSAPTTPQAENSGTESADPAN